MCRRPKSNITIIDFSPKILNGIKFCENAKCNFVKKFVESPNWFPWVVENVCQNQLEWESKKILFDHCVKSDNVEYLKRMTQSALLDLTNREHVIWLESMVKRDAFFAFSSSFKNRTQKIRQSKFNHTFYF